MTARALDRQYTAPTDLARQLQERDREAQAEFARTLARVALSEERQNAAWIYPEDYGAARDGQSDDTIALQLAIETAEETGSAVRLSPGVYRITGCLRIRGTLIMSGTSAAVVYTTATNLSCFRIMSTSSDAVLEGFTVRGNNTGVGGFVIGEAGGHGIACDASVNTLIYRMRFEQIGVDSGDPTDDEYACPVVSNGSSGIIVKDCYFAPTCFSRTGADVNVVGLDTTVIGCRSESFQDSFVNLGGGGDRIRHIVRDNFAVRTEAAFCRSAVLTAYGSDSPTFADISHNQFEGFKWHGVYSVTVSTADSGSIIVAHNTIRHCGGQDDLTIVPNQVWPGAAVKIVGRSGAIIEGNIIYGSGYSPDFVARDTPVSGVVLVGNTCNQTICNNKITHGSDAAVAIDSLGSAASEIVRNIVVADNIVEDNAGHGITVSSQTTNLETITDVEIIGNTIRVSGASASGIVLSASNGGWSNRVHFINNNIVHTDPGASAAAGIVRPGYSDYTRYTGQVIGNDVQGFTTAISIGGTVGLYCPRAVLVQSNRVGGCANGMALGAGTAWQVHIDTTGSATTNLSPGRSRPGRILGGLSTSTSRVEMFLEGAGGGGLPSLTPLDGTWEVNDRTLLMIPFGPVTGYRCVTAGTPGVWQPIYGATSRTVSRAQARFGQTAPDSFGIAAPTFTGTATTAAWAATSVFTRTTRVAAEDTAASTSAVAGIRATDADWFLQTGYYIRLRWAAHLGQTVSTGRAFAGMIQATGAPTDVDPSGLTNLIGMGWDDDDTNVQIMRNDGSGSATKTDLGSSFPVPSANDTNVYQLEIFATPGASNIYFRIENVTTGVATTANANSNFPGTTTQLCGYHIYSSVGGTSGTTGVCLCEFEGQRPA